jgi:hypothetical protein
VNFVRHAPPGWRAAIDPETHRPSWTTNPHPASLIGVLDKGVWMIAFSANLGVMLKILFLEY